MNLIRFSFKNASILSICLLILLSLLAAYAVNFKNTAPNIKIELPLPRYSSKTSVEYAIKQRRSIREYKPEAITLADLSQLLWAAQGITSQKGFRSSPSAGALYPLQIYIVVGNLVDLPKGVYRYLSENHTLESLTDKDIRKELAKASYDQSYIQNSSVDIIIAANYKKTTKKYGKRGKRFVYMEAGHVAENIYLQCVSLGLGTVSVGGFQDKKIKSILKINDDPLYIMPVGKIVNNAE